MQVLASWYRYLRCVTELWPLYLKRAIGCNCNTSFFRTNRSRCLHMTNTCGHPLTVFGQVAANPIVISCTGRSGQALLHSFFLPVGMTHGGAPKGVRD